MATVSTKIEVEGAGAFKKNFQDASLAVKSAKAELTYFSDELNRTGKTEANFTNQQKALEKAMKAESDAVALLEEKIAKLAEQGGASAERQMTRLTGELYKHKNAEAELQHQLDTLGDQAEETGNQFGSDMADDLAKATVFLEKAVDLAVNVAKKFVEVGKNAVSYNATMESYEKTIEAFFKTSGQTAAQASRNTKDLIAKQKQLSSVLGISSSALIEANKMLISSGVEGKRSQEAIEGLAKAIIATGGGSAELSRMAQNLQQISNTGKASAQDLKQFAAAGIDVYGLLADSTGKSVEELKEMDVTFDDIVMALTQATSEGGKFFEASQVGATTLNGQISTLQTEIQEGLGTAFQPVNDALKNDLIPAAQNFVEKIDWDSIGDALAVAVEGASKLVEVISWFYDNYSQAVDENREKQAQAMLDLASDSDEVKQKVFTDMQDAAHESGRLILSDLTDLKTGHNEAMDKMVEGTMKYSDQLPKLTNQVKTELNEKLPNVFEEMNKASEKWGLEFTTGYANGMMDGISSIEVAAERAAEAAAGPLHFSRPDYGPLRDYERWMPDFVSGLARTMQNSMWMIENAAGNLAQTITNNSVNNTFNMTITGSAGQSVNDLADAVMIRIQQATDRRSAVWA